MTKTIYEYLKQKLNQADGAISKQIFLYQTLGEINIAHKAEFINGAEYCVLSSECCQKINNPQYFD